MAIASVSHAPGTGSAGPAPGPARHGRRLTPYLLLAPGMLWLTFFFLAPIGFLFITSLETPTPGGDVGAFQLVPGAFADYWNNYVNGLTSFVPQLVRSFEYAGIATVLALLISYPLAYMIAFKAGRWRNVLLVLVVAPFFCSFILRTIAWRQILADEGWPVQTMKALHLIGPTTSVNVGMVAVVAGITYNFLPFMTLPLYSSLERIDPRLLEAGADLYGNGWTVLRKVTFPLSMPGVVSGTLLTFIPAAGDYVNASLLGNRNTWMLGNVIDSRFFKVSDYPTAAVLSFVLMVTILILVMAYIYRAGTEELV